jgi:hypothetical protein
MICMTCGSDDVARVAWAGWDVEVPQWVLASVFDQAFCHTCETETKLLERNIGQVSPFSPAAAIA